MPGSITLVILFIIFVAVYPCVPYLKGILNKKGPKKRKISWTDLFDL